MKKDKNVSMNREIRENMKKVIAEKGFGYWFKNVFWYHYGKLSICLLAAIIIAVAITVEGAHQVKYDFNMVIALDGEIAYSYTDELQQTVADAVGDVNGDGKVRVNIQIIDLGDAENLEANQERLQLMFSQAEYSLYIMDDYYSSIYCEREYFDPAENYGFTPDTEYDRRVNITDTPIMQCLNKKMPEKLEYYASVCDWTADGKGKQEWTDAAVRALNAIISAK